VSVVAQAVAHLELVAAALWHILLAVLVVRAAAVL